MKFDRQLRKGTAIMTARRHDDAVPQPTAHSAGANSEIRWAADAREVGESLIERGYASLVLLGADLDALVSVYSEAFKFFDQDESWKLRHASPDFNFGFRPFGRQYSLVPDRPDMCESFAYWSDSASRVPESTRIMPFIKSIESYRRVLVRLIRGALDGIARRYSYDGALEFEKASCLEANWYIAGQDRDLLQDRHEDGHLLTVVTADAPGLEIEVGGQMRPVEFRQGQLILMPGSLLTDMTGGAIPPLFHQVRNRHCSTRMSLLYQVNPQVEGGIRPFIVNDYNRHLDIAERARQIGRSFGLPQAPIV